jgi:nucleotide-binding universal stress UspA family protein
VAKKILVPVVPSERFYDAVVAAGDLIASEGGTISFVFTTVRPPPMWSEKRGAQHDSEAELEAVDLVEEDETVDAWRDEMLSQMDEARDLLYERGLSDEQLNYIFTDYGEPPAQAIADEAAAGAYDLVVLSRGEFLELPDGPGNPVDIAAAVQELAGDGVKLLVS